MKHEFHRARECSRVLIETARSGVLTKPGPPAIFVSDALETTRSFCRRDDIATKLVVLSSNGSARVAPVVVAREASGVVARDRGPRCCLALFGTSEQSSTHCVPSGVPGATRSIVPPGEEPCVILTTMVEKTLHHRATTTMTPLPQAATLQFRSGSCRWECL
jgi:hypothetical protein